MQFIDLQAQRVRIEEKINKAVKDAIEGGAYIMGPQLREFEAQLAEFGQACHAIGCANGTDALALPLMAWGIGEGDAVFCPSFTFCATGEVAPWVGATPIFVDIDPATYNLDPVQLEKTILAVQEQGKLVPKVVIAVDLFGQPANYPEIKSICDRYDLKLIADSAQGFGCTLNGKHPVHWADVATTSFFPAKPLGCYGDGGAVLTGDEELVEVIRSIQVHGKGKDKYDNVRIGLNSRLDTLQAAILIEKLAIFADEIEKRNEIAARYNKGLRSNKVSVPHVIEGGISSWAQYTIEHPDRNGLQAHLKEKDIPTAIYYPIPLHRQTAYKDFPAPLSMQVSEEKASSVISLPMHPYLDRKSQDKIIDAVTSFN